MSSSSDRSTGHPGAALEEKGSATPPVEQLMGAPAIASKQIEEIVQSRLDAPFDVLGPHPSDDGSSTTVRTFLPYAHRVFLRILDGVPSEAEMRRIHEQGLFETTVCGRHGKFAYELLVHDEGGTIARIRDPYSFRERRFGADDEILFRQGKHHRLFEKLGAQPTTRCRVPGVTFAVWAPHALRVSVVGPFNKWDGRCHQMQRGGAAGVFELFIPDIGAGEPYKFEIKTPGDAVFLKADPFAVRSEAPPNSASIVYDAGHAWRDADWIRRRRASSGQDRGYHPYCLALEGRENGPGRLSTDLSKDVLRRLKQNGYTDIELTLAQGFRGSVDLFALGMLCARPEQVMAFIDSCHRHQLGIVFQICGTDFPEALDHLACFDGAPLYEAGVGPATRSRTFDLEKGEVLSFLRSNAVFWVEKYHVDALKTDCAGWRVYRGIFAGERNMYAGARIILELSEPAIRLPADEITKIVTARHPDPHAILGPHCDPDAREITVRAMAPGAEAVQVLFDDEPQVVCPMRAIHEDGLFELTIAEVRPAYRLRVIEPGGRVRDLVDPYSLTEFRFQAADQRLFGDGNHYRIFDKLGAHRWAVYGVSGVSFAVWAPNAEGVSVVGPFNGWDGRIHQMKRHSQSGVWETFVPDIGEGDLYKYEIRPRNGHAFLKVDPYAFFSEVPPGTANIIYDPADVHVWHDREWMERRAAAKPWQQPLAIYEVHLGSWRRDGAEGHASYRHMAGTLIPYVKRMGFTHIELLPIAEHPYEPSWGYQVSNFYAPSSRYGRPEELMAFVDACHRQGIGVILDWVPGHFPKDAHALAWFDGTHLYEHADPRRGEHRDWGTLIFNYGRHEVENFLIANALFWLEMYHFDGLRVDAVASMLYLDYSRPTSGEWIPNVFGGRENLEATEFLKHTNAIVHARFPGVLMIAEESTSWPNVSRPAHLGGLGFGFKWNMGWMHDVLAYMSTPPDQRKHHHGKLTFGISYAFSENFILSLSHDEVVHMKGSLFNKMPGDEQEKFANLRLLFAFMYAHPGKKLLFMGGEFGQESEWNHARDLEWHLLERKPNHRLARLLRDLNRLYRSERALFEADIHPAGFEWLDVDNAEQSILAFVRKARDPRNALIVVLNFSAVSRPYYRLGVPYPVSYREIFNSNDIEYGGPGSWPTDAEIRVEEIPFAGREVSLSLPMPALSAVILKPAAPDVSPAIT